MTDKALDGRVGGSGGGTRLASRYLSHRSYELNGFGKSTPPQNRLLIVLTGDIRSIFQGDQLTYKALDGRAGGSDGGGGLGAIAGEQVREVERGDLGRRKLRS